MCLIEEALFIKRLLALLQFFEQKPDACGLHRSRIQLAPSVAVIQSLIAKVSPRTLAEANITQASCASCSFSEKYTCPDGWYLQLETSPSTVIRDNNRSPSKRLRTYAFTWETRNVRSIVRPLAVVLWPGKPYRLSSVSSAAVFSGSG